MGFFVCICFVFLKEGNKKKAPSNSVMGTLKISIEGMSNRNKVILYIKDFQNFKTRNRNQYLILWLIHWLMILIIYLGLCRILKNVGWLRDIVMCVGSSSILAAKNFQISSVFRFSYFISVVLMFCFVSQ